MPKEGRDCIVCRVYCFGVEIASQHSEVVFSVKRIKSVIAQIIPVIARSALRPAENQFLEKRICLFRLYSSGTGQPGFIRHPWNSDILLPEHLLHRQNLVPVSLERLMSVKGDEIITSAPFGQCASHEPRFRRTVFRKIIGEPCCRYDCIRVALFHSFEAVFLEFDIFIRRKIGEAEFRFVPDFKIPYFPTCMRSKFFRPCRKFAVIGALEFF